MRKYIMPIGAALLAVYSSGCATILHNLNQKLNPWAEEPVPELSDSERAAQIAGAATEALKSAYDASLVEIFDAIDGGGDLVELERRHTATRQSVQQDQTDKYVLQNRLLKARKLQAPTTLTESYQVLEQLPEDSLKKDYRELAGRKDHLIFDVPEDLVAIDLTLENEHLGIFRVTTGGTYVLARDESESQPSSVTVRPIKSVPSPAESAPTEQVS